MIVVDTQLCVYTTIPLPESALARQVFQMDPEWAVPFLWRSEFRSAMLGYIRTGRATIHEAESAFEIASGFVAGREHHVNTRQLLALSAGNRITAYDLEFVTLAQELDVPLVTFDREVLRAFPALAVHPAEFSPA